MKRLLLVTSMLMQSCATTNSCDDMTKDFISLYDKASHTEYRMKHDSAGTAVQLVRHDGILDILVIVENPLIALQLSAGGVSFDGECTLDNGKKAPFAKIQRQMPKEAPPKET